MNGVHNMSSVWARHGHVGLHFWQSFQYLNGLWGTCTCGMACVHGQLPDIYFSFFYFISNSNRRIYIFNLVHFFN